jgi:hypothetical protein
MFRPRLIELHPMPRSDALFRASRPHMQASGSALRMPPTALVYDEFCRKTGQFGQRFVRFREAALVAAQ